MVSFFRMVPASPVARWFLGVMAILFVGISGLCGYLAWSSRHTHYVVSPAGLRIEGAYGRTLPTRELVVADARWVDFAQEPDLRPASRTNGVGMPGYLAGWARLRGGERALAYLTDPQRVVMVPTRSGYVFLASVTDPEAFLAALAAPRGVSGFAMPPAADSAFWFALGITAFNLAMSGLMVYLGVLSRRVRYEVGPAGLRIVGLYGRMIPVASLLPGEARQVDLSQEASLRPVIRTNGAGLPGLLIGWVRLATGAKALVFLTDRRRVVHVPTREGYSLLLSVESPAQFLDALRENS
jgi:hypothetical protein